MQTFKVWAVKHVPVEGEDSFEAVIVGGDGLGWAVGISETCSPDIKAMMLEFVGDPKEADLESYRETHQEATVQVGPPLPMVADDVQEARDLAYDLFLR